MKNYIEKFYLSKFKNYYQAIKMFFFLYSKFSDIILLQIKDN